MFKKMIALALSAMTLTSLCSALEPVQEQEAQPVCVVETTLSQLTGEAQAEALADLAALRGDAPMAAAYGLANEDVSIFIYEAVEEESGLVHQTTFYDLSGTSRASGTYGGGYTTNYLLSGVSLFKIYMYASFDVTSGLVNGNRSQSQIWASGSNVILSDSTIEFRPENSATCYANGSCQFNYQNGRYTGTFRGTVTCTDSGQVVGGEKTVHF